MNYAMISVGVVDKTESLTEIGIVAVPGIR